MKHSSFALPSLNTVRHPQEQHAVEKYARAMTELEQAQTRLRELQATCEAIRETIQAQLAIGVTSEKVEQTYNYALTVNEYRQRAEAAVERAYSHATRCWQSLMATRKACKATPRPLGRHRDLAWDEQYLLDDPSNCYPSAATQFGEAMELAGALTRSGVEL